MKKEANTYNRIPGLDGLRAIAVIFVFTRHVTLNYFAYLFGITDSSIGETGVLIFFVLSGFLITKIILENNDHPIKEKVLYFYSRRFLRITPPLLIFLVIGFLTHAGSVTSLWLWHITFTTNIYIATTSSWINEASHLWSLDVEEQFYLVWPLLFWFVRNKETQLCLIISFILFGIAAEIFMLCYIRNGFYEYALPFRYAFELASGGALAFMYVYKKGFFRPIDNINKYLFPCIFLTLFSILIINITPYNQSAVLLSNFIVTICILLIIWSCIVNKNNLVVKTLEISLLRWLGLISYGLYIYHPIVIYILQYTRYSYNNTHSIYGYIAYCIVTLVLSSASFYLIERPVMTFKRYFIFKN